MKFRNYLLSIVVTFCLFIDEHHGRLCPEDTIDKLRKPRTTFQTENYYSECYPQDTVRYEPTTENEISGKRPGRTKKVERQKTIGVNHSNLFLRRQKSLAYLQYNNTPLCFVM
jgi:hypothetical protein